jgi:hypothetical protein
MICPAALLPQAQWTAYRPSFCNSLEQVKPPAAPPALPAVFCLPKMPVQAVLDPRLAPPPLFAAAVAATAAAAAASLPGAAGANGKATVAAEHGPRRHSDATAAFAAAAASPAPTSSFPFALAGRSSTVRVGMAVSPTRKEQQPMQPLLATTPLPLPPPAAVEASAPAPRERDTDSESTADVPVLANWLRSGPELMAGWADLSEGSMAASAPISGGHRDDRWFDGCGGGGGGGGCGEDPSMVTLGSCPDEDNDGGTDSDHPMPLALPPTILAAFGYPAADEAAAAAAAAAAVPDVFSESESVPGHRWDGLWDCQCWGPPCEPARADFDVQVRDDVSYGDPGPLVPEDRPGHAAGEWWCGLLGPPAEAAE